MTPLVEVAVSASAAPPQEKLAHGGLRTPTRSAIWPRARLITPSRHSRSKRALAHVRNENQTVEEVYAYKMALLHLVVCKFLPARYFPPFRESRQPSARKPSAHGRPFQLSDAYVGPPAAALPLPLQTQGVLQVPMKQGENTPRCSLTLLTYNPCVFVLVR